MRYLILFCAAGCLAGAGEALAESSADFPDCDAIRTTLIPYQITVTKDKSVIREFHTIQVVRNSSGADNISSRMNGPGPYILKGIATNGWRTISDTQYFQEQSPTRVMHSTLEFDGVDFEQMDMRSNRKFVIKLRWGEMDGEAHEAINEVSYKYVKVENVAIGPCTFRAVIGEQTLTDRKTGKAQTIFGWYFPDLRLMVGHTNRAVTFQTISTTFEPIEFVESSWPLPTSNSIIH